MSFDEKRYINTKPYVSRSKEPETFAAYQAEKARIHELFMNDLFTDLGIQNNPKRFKLFEIAWNDHHSAGYPEVWYKAGDLVELIL